MGMLTRAYLRVNERFTLAGWRLSVRGLRLTMSVLRYQLTEDDPEREPVDYRVPEVSVQVHRVVVSPALTLNLKHIRSAQVSDQPPDSSLSERHVIGDLPDRTTRMHCNVEQHRAVTGDKVPVVVYMVSVRRHWFSNLMLPRILIPAA